MTATDPERLIPKLLATAGIAINGDRPWDLHVHNDLLFRRLAAGGSMALGES